MLEKFDFRVGQQHAKFRAGKALMARLALGDLDVGRQRFHLTVEQAFGFQRADKMRVRAQAVHGHVLHHRYRLVLPVIVRQHKTPNFVGHRSELRIALIEGQFAALDRVVEQDLDVDLMVRGVDACGIVDEVGVEQHMMLRCFDAAFLRETEVAPLADHLAAQLLAVDAQRIVRTVTDVGIALALGFDVGADTAVPEQVDRRFQDRAHQRIRRQLRGCLIEAEHTTDFR